MEKQIFLESKNGYFGEGDLSFGGCFVPEILYPSLKNLQRGYKQIFKHKDFKRELKFLLKTFAGRPTPLIYAKNTSKILSNHIYLKFEGLANTGAHKINNALAQVLLAKKMNKKHIIAETGAGQHGVAVSSVCAFLNIPCTIFMGEIDIQRQRPNVFIMEQFGAKVISVKSGTKTLKDAVNECLREWSKDPDNSFYVLGSALGPYPYPDIVREAQKIIGKEIKKQLQKTIHVLPDYVIACVGGGSNAMGAFSAFLKEERVKLIGVEAGGDNFLEGKNAMRLSEKSCANIGIAHGYKSYFLQNQYGQIDNTHSISAGLDYAGVGPQLAHLASIGRVEFLGVSDQQALEAMQFFARHEGILSALESSHALAGVIRIAKNIRDKIIVVNVSGRGDKDIFITAKELVTQEWRDFLFAELQSVEKKLKQKNSAVQQEIEENSTSSVSEITNDLIQGLQTLQHENFEFLDLEHNHKCDTFQKNDVACSKDTVSVHNGRQNEILEDTQQDIADETYRDDNPTQNLENMLGSLDSTLHNENLKTQNVAIFLEQKKLQDCDIKSDDNSIQSSDSYIKDDVITKGQEAQDCVLERDSINQDSLTLQSDVDINSTDIKNIDSVNKSMHFKSLEFLESDNNETQDEYMLQNRDVLAFFGITENNDATIEIKQSLESQCDSDEIQHVNTSSESQYFDDTNSSSQDLYQSQSNLSQDDLMHMQLESERLIEKLDMLSDDSNNTESENLLQATHSCDNEIMDNQNDSDVSFKFTLSDMTDVMDTNTAYSGDCTLQDDSTTQHRQFISAQFISDSNVEIPTQIHVSQDLEEDVRINLQSVDEALQFGVENSEHFVSALFNDDLLSQNDESPQKSIHSDNPILNLSEILESSQNTESIMQDERECNNIESTTNIDESEILEKEFDTLLGVTELEHSSEVQENQDFITDNMDNLEIKYQNYLHDNRQNSRVFETHPELSKICGKSLKS